MVEAAKRIGLGEVCMMDVIEVNTNGESIAAINELCFGLLGGLLLSMHRALFESIGRALTDCVSYSQI